MRHIFEYATFENLIASFNMNEITFSLSTNTIL